MSDIYSLKNAKILKTCWFCKTHYAVPNAAAPALIYRPTYFLNFYTNQIIDLILCYEPTKLPIILEIIHEARCGDDVTQAYALDAIEMLLSNKPAGTAVFKALRMQDYSKTAGQLHYSAALIEVPRCQICRNIHQRVKTAAWFIKFSTNISTGLAALGTLATVVNFQVMCLSNTHLRLALLIGMIVAGCSAIIYYNKPMLAALMACNTQPESYKHKFPTVLDRLHEGWKPGSKPPNR